ncbi:DEAD/DEAH box helicase, partial [bacterium]|nr:DEAD/DEAH box helicase [bacterium]
HIIAALAEYVTGFKGHRALVLAHVKELLVQNKSKFKEPENVGIYSAGLKERETDKPIIVAGIQSVYNKSEQLGDFTVIIVDESHRIGNNQDEGMYWQLLKEYPNAKIVGFTATPHRTGEGKTGWGEICHVTSVDKLTPQYLSPLVYKAPVERMDVSKVQVKMGDYVISQLEDAATTEETTRKSLKALLEYGKDRQAWLVFAVSVKHAEIMAQALNDNGVTSKVISGDTPPLDRELAISDFKNGALRCLVNCNILTVGFDAPNVDFLGILRPTMSLSLHEQILYRGTRKAAGKVDCLVCDMAWNTLEHGKLGETNWGNIASTEAKPKQTNKVCVNCESLAKLTDKECAECGYIFPAEEIKREVNHHDRPMDEKDFLVDDWQDVTGMNLKYVVSKKSIPMMKVEYMCGYQSYDEYVFIGHPVGSWANKNARKWIADNGIDARIPSSAEGAQAVQIAMKYEYRKPKRIYVKKAKSKDFPEITGYEY